MWRQILLFSLSSLCLSSSTSAAGILENLENFLQRLIARVGVPEEEYDFVIVGAGAAGSVLANRLTEQNDWRVLLLEAGEEENFYTNIPLNAATLRDSGYYWERYSEPSPTGRYATTLVGGRCNFGTGKAIGGSTVVNFMIYSRGSPLDYDSWEADGNPGWAYRDILPYFIKSENNQLFDVDNRFHGRGGYLNVMEPPYKSELGEAFLQAGLEMGYEIVDYNSDRVVGFSGLQANIRNGERFSAFKAFLRPIRDRRNFVLSKSSLVTKIRIDSDTRKATGVEYTKDGLRYFAKARKEVIVSAGALNSPQLLMLSGIGPEDHLESLKIKVLEDLPVGHNLQDHMSFPYLLFLVNESVTVVGPRTLLNPVNAYDYIVRGTGVFSAPGGGAGLSFFNTKSPKMVGREKKSFSQNDIPDIRTITVDPGYFESNTDITMNETKQIADIELILGLSAITGEPTGSYRHLLSMPKKVYDETFLEYELQNVFSMVPVILQPKSIGRMYLRSKNPLDASIYEPNYFGHPEDVRAMIRAIRMGIEIASTKAFQRFDTTLLPAVFSACKNTIFNSDAYWECAIRAASMTIGHFSGTCKMGKREKQGVVDHRLKVHGIHNLRVVDASIMPNIVSGHTTAPVYMIAEKASDMIKEDWGLRNV